MPSSITLTVRSLPQSTSFFLSALQPLDYQFRGRAGNTIGFGPASDPSHPPDFWITQEIAGVPAGAAHVAFPASSHREVQQFFTAALKAGGKIHGEPAIRDSSGYYSAAVIDFDGNSIEAVYRPDDFDDKENAASNALVPQSNKSTVSKASAARTALVPSTVAPSKVSSVRSLRDRDQGTTIDGDVLDNIFAEVRGIADTARRAVQAFRPTPTTMKSDSAASSRPDDSKAVVGTLLGMAAGAALTYALTSNDDKPHRPSQARSKTMPVEKTGSVYDGPRRRSAPSGRVYEMEEVEVLASAPRGRRSSVSGASAVSDRRSSHSRRSSSHSRFEPIRMIEAPPTTVSHRSSSRSRAGRSEATTIKAPKQSPQSTSGRSTKSKAYPPSAFPAALPTPPSTVTTARKYPLPPSTVSTARKYPLPPSTVTTARQYPLPPSTVSAARKQPLPASRQTSVYTMARERSQSRSSRHRQPEDYALPPSRKGSTYTAYEGSERRGRSGSIMDEEVTPDDSISQISVNRSSRSGRSRRR